VTADAGETVTYTCECCDPPQTSRYERAAFNLIMRSRVAQGLPFHVTDPIVLAKVAQLLGDELRITDEERARRAKYAREAEESRQREREARKAQAVVYYVHKGDRIKIGTTTVGEKRWKTHGGALLATEPGSHALERQRHERFAASRIGASEWFQATPELLAWIATLQRLTLEGWHRKEPRP
jgi:hypothetical protein